MMHVCRLEGTGQCNWYQRKCCNTTPGQKNHSLQWWRKGDFPKISRTVWKISTTGESNWKLKLIQFESSQGRRFQTVGRLASIRWGGGPSCLPLRTGGRELHNQLMDKRPPSGNRGRWEAGRFPCKSCESWGRKHSRLPSKSRQQVSYSFRSTSLTIKWMRLHSWHVKQKSDGHSFLIFSGTS